MSWEAILVKLADRTANVETGGKIDMYRKGVYDVSQYTQSTHSRTERFGALLKNIGCGNGWTKRWNGP